MNNKDLITQYVDTGLPISEYQIAKLSSNDKGTYIRKRIIASETMNDLYPYEIPLLGEKESSRLLNNMLFDDIPLNKISLEVINTDGEEYLSELTRVQIERLFNEGNLRRFMLDKNLFNMLSDDLKKVYVRHKQKFNIPLLRDEIPYKKEMKK